MSQLNLPYAQKLTNAERMLMEQHIQHYTGINTSHQSTVNIVPITMNLVSTTSLANQERRDLAEHLLSRISASENNDLDAKINWGDQIDIQYNLSKGILAVKLKKPFCCPCFSDMSFVSDQKGTRVTANSDFPAPVASAAAPAPVGVAPSNPVDIVQSGPVINLNLGSNQQVSA